MTDYEIYKLLHVIGAIVWVGAGVGFMTLMWRLIRSKEDEGLQAVNRQLEKIGAPLFGGAFVLVVGGGVAMVLTEPVLSFSDTWIVIGIVAIALSIAIQEGFTRRIGQRLVTTAEAHGLGSDRAQDLARRALVGNGLDLGFLLVAVWAMVTKPGL